MQAISSLTVVMQASSVGGLVGGSVGHLVGGSVGGLVGSIRSSVWLIGQINGLSVSQLVIGWLVYHNKTMSSLHYHR
jgi:hypothetical protein